ncbi:MAG: hypothetical protein ACOYN0_03680 [Phycisphaerales bacterium]
MLTRYEPSGKCDLLFKVLIPIAALAAGGLGWIHGFLLNTGKGRPIGTSLLFVIFMASAMIVYAMVSIARCRSRTWAILLALIVALSALGAAHARVYARDPAGYAAGTPVIEWMTARVNKGTPVPFATNTTASGLWAWALWSAELAGLVAFLCFVSLDTVGEAFCEKCRTLADKHKRTAELPCPSDALVQEAKVCATLSTLRIDEAPADFTKQRWLVFTGSACSCGELQTLSIELEEHSSRKSERGDASGKRYRTSKSLRSQLVVSAEDHQRLEELLDSLQLREKQAAAQNA